MHRRAVDCTGVFNDIVFNPFGWIFIDRFFFLFMEEMFEIQRINCEISGLELDLKLSTIIK